MERVQHGSSSRSSRHGRIILTCQRTFYSDIQGLTVRQSHGSWPEFLRNENTFGDASGRVQRVVFTLVGNFGGVTREVLGGEEGGQSILQVGVNDSNSRLARRVPLKA